MVWAQPLRKVLSRPAFQAKPSLYAGVGGSGADILAAARRAQPRSRAERRGAEGPAAPRAPGPGRTRQRTTWGRRAAGVAARLPAASVWVARRLGDAGTGPRIGQRGTEKSWKQKEGRSRGGRGDGARHPACAGVRRANFQRVSPREGKKKERCSMWQATHEMLFSAVPYESLLLINNSKQQLL